MAQDNSSLPLLLTITGAVVGVAVGGWFFLDQSDTAPAATTPPAASSTLDTPTASDVAEADLDVADTAEPVVAATPISPSAADVNLRKAQLAAGSGILVFPEDSSALHYYGLVLADEPNNAIARAERDTVLAEVQQGVTAQLAAEEFSEAFSVAALVARQVPDHPLVVETQSVIDERAGSLVDEAIQLARSGNDAEAASLLATAEALPGRNADYFVAVRESITEIRDVRVAAEQERQRRARLADDQARDAWVQQVRGAIADGNLIFPEGASAAEFLAESNAWDAERAELTSELRTALVAAVSTAIGQGELEDAEVILEHTYSMDGGTEDLDPLRASLEDTFANIQSQKIVQVSALTRVSTEPPRYPKHAIEREITGWVDVYFTVTPEGNTADVEVFDAKPTTIFNKAAIRAVQKWQFEPVEYRGRVINQRVATRLAFELD